MRNELIDELAGLYGIVHEYWDIFGNKHITTSRTKEAILNAMGLNISSEEDIKNEIDKRKFRPWNRFLEPVRVISEKAQPLKFSIHIGLEDRDKGPFEVFWILIDEDKNKEEYFLQIKESQISEERWICGKRYVRIDLEDNKKRPIGYYSFRVRFKSQIMEISGKSKIIIAPDTCFIPNELNKTWGLSLNLYSIRSSENWGVGDFGDLKKIIKWISDLKGGFVGINPLHAISNKSPFGISPYSPISRLYKNIIYLEMESIPEINKDEVLKKKEEIRDLVESKLIDYERVAALKLSMLNDCFEKFYQEHYLKDTERGMAFKRFVYEEGESLEYFATFLALSEYFGEKNKNFDFSWKNWHEHYRNPSSIYVKEFREIHRKRILFYQYIQWLIEEQIKELSNLAKDCGMSVGLYHDLAIGSIGQSCDTWMSQDLFAMEIDLGAPPDDFNPDGQNWGFPPLMPNEIEEDGYDFFIKVIRKNMKHFGALRIDHALGMFRQFWIPRGCHPKEGAYVSFNHEDLLRIIALESVRNNTIVVAEDLGTIGENVRENLSRFNMLSYRLLYFERDYPDPSFLPPERYPEMALCSVTTHDLPTIYGWWKGRDIEVKRRLGLFSDEGIYQRCYLERKRDKELLLRALESQGLIEKSDFHAISEMDPELCLKIYEYLARTPCRLLSVNLDDILGTMDQQNMPGVVGTYPSWRQKTFLNLGDIISNKSFIKLSEFMKKNCR
jgi:4-alpha-glucanotransferase